MEVTASSGRPVLSSADMLTTYCTGNNFLTKHAERRSKSLHERQHEKHLLATYRHAIPNLQHQQEMIMNIAGNSRIKSRTETILKTFKKGVK
jgi:hypothetical protein